MSEQEEQYYDDLLGRGAGDPDVFPIPCYHDDFRVRPVSGFEDKYLVTANGQVYSKTRQERAHAQHTRTRTGRWLKSSGIYPAVELADGKRHSVHRLVAKVFVPNPANNPHVNHIDGDKQHNCATNLEWCTQSENVQHGVDIGLAPSGEDKPNAKLTIDNIEQIRALYGSGKTQASIAEMFGVHKKTIFNIVHNRQSWVKA